jgi:hypothetical protein
VRTLKLRKLGSVRFENKPDKRRNNSVSVVSRLRTGRPGHRCLIPGFIRGLSLLHSVRAVPGASHSLVYSFFGCEVAGA